MMFVQLLPAIWATTVSLLELAIGLTLGYILIFDFRTQAYAQLTKLRLNLIRMPH